MNKAQAFREAGRVKRFHANVVTYEQTVAEHSWNMLMLARALHPGPSRELMWAIISHDIHERWTGDVPGPAKWWLDARFTDALHDLETHVNHQLGLEFHLTIQELGWLQALDWLEGWLFAQDELAQGNRHVEHVVKAYARLFEEKREKLPNQIVKFVDEYEWERQPDVI